MKCEVKGRMRHLFWGMGRVDFSLLTSNFLLLKVFYKMTTPAANNNILHTLIPQRLIVQVMHMQMRFAPAQNALTIVMSEKLLPLNLP